MAKAKTKAAAVKRKPAKTQARAATRARGQSGEEDGCRRSPPRRAQGKRCEAGKGECGKGCNQCRGRRQSGRQAADRTESRAADAARGKTERSARREARRLSCARSTESAATRADLPPADGFTLLVDGHFKNQFDDLKGAKAAATELKSRFPMLRVEIYDAANKARLPA